MTIENLKFDTLLRIKQVTERTGISKTTLYNWIKEGKFPKAIHVQGSRMSSWPSSDIDEWIAEQKTSSRNIPETASTRGSVEKPTPTPRKRNVRGDKPVKA